VPDHVELHVVDARQLVAATHRGQRKVEAGAYIEPLATGLASDAFAGTIRTGRCRRMRCSRSDQTQRRKHGDRGNPAPTLAAVHRLSLDQARRADAAAYEVYAVAPHEGSHAVREVMPPVSTLRVSA